MSTPTNHDHIWSVIGVTPPPPLNRPIHPREMPAPVYTLILIRCDYCRLVQVEKVEGHWTELQIRRGSDAASDTQAE
jgi:hypothetical protein